MDAAFQQDLVAVVPRLRRFAYALTGSRDTGDDLVQSACERALRNSDSFQQGTRLDSWMYRIIQNLWLDDRRKEKVRGTQIDSDSIHLSDQGAAAKRLDDRMTLAQIRLAVDSLPEDQKSVLVLVAIEGINYREAAEILGIPIGTIMSRLSRARDRLFEIMDNSAADGSRRAG